MKTKTKKGSRRIPPINEDNDDGLTSEQEQSMDESTERDQNEEEVSTSREMEAPQEQEEQAEVDQGEDEPQAITKFENENQPIEDIDTTDVFHHVFQGKNQFDSWEEFITPFEEFQLLTNSVFKPKSSVCVDWINEKRREDKKIPSRFVYSTVTMICQHYGVSVKKAGSTRKRESYVGQGCEACVKLSYTQGFLHITRASLVHSNHSLEKTNAESQMRRIRPVIFDDDLDMLVCKVAEDCNVFKSRTSETNWQAAVTQLTESDPKLEFLTRRMLKKRLSFLMERFAENSGGRAPLEDDEMGAILYRLLQQKSLAMAPTPKKRGRPRKNGNSADYVDRRFKRSHGRAKKNFKRIRQNDDDDFIDDSGVDYGSLGDQDDDDHGSSYPTVKRRKMSEADVSIFLNYWSKRDAEDRRMRAEELELRKEELELQKSRFELEQKERLNLTEVLKNLSQVLANSRRKPQGTTKEYILNKDGSLEPVTHDEEPPRVLHQPQYSHTMPQQQQRTTNMPTHSTPISHHGQQSMPVHSGGVPVHGHMHGHAGGMPGHPSSMGTHPHQGMNAHGHMV